MRAGILIDTTKGINRMNEEIALIIDKNTREDFKPGQPTVFSHAMTSNNEKDVYTIYDVVFADIEYDPNNPSNVTITSEDKARGIINANLFCSKKKDLVSNIDNQTQENIALEDESTIKINDTNSMVLSVGLPKENTENTETVSDIIEKTAEETPPAESKPLWFKKMFNIFNIFKKKN